MLEIIERDIGFLQCLYESWSTTTVPHILFMVLGYVVGLYGLRSYKKSSKAIILASISMLFSSLWEIVNEASVYLFMNNRLTFKIFDLSEAIILSVVLYLFIPQRYSSYIKWQSVIVVILGITLGTVVVGLHEPGDYAAILFDLHIVLLCAIYFYKILDKIYDQRLELTPSFWIVSGVLIHVSISLLIKGTMSLSTESSDLNSLWILLHIARLLMYLFFAYAFYLTNKKWIQ